jgi:acyl CoA:acetate/3-ketoacid CoA transferase alpha subunit
MTLETTKKVEPTGVIKEVVNKPTKDLYLASAFHCEGCKLTQVDKTDRSRMIFVFEGGELADRVERQWYEGTLVVSATSYAASLRLMKSAIHS